MPKLGQAANAGGTEARQRRLDQNETGLENQEIRLEHWQSAGPSTALQAGVKHCGLSLSAVRTHWERRTESKRKM